jgi:hypothetical protein
MAVQSVDWAPENLAALKQIEEFRGTRNILAHCVIRRFPEDDAFAFLFKSAEDYKEHFGTDPPYGMTMTAVVDRAQLFRYFLRSNVSKYGCRLQLCSSRIK